MGNLMSSRSKKSPKEMKEPDQLFQREKWKLKKKREVTKQAQDPRNRRPMVVQAATVGDPPPVPRPAPALNSDYDAEAIKRMRNQLEEDADAFLLNNILMSVQFFKNYEQELYELKNNAPANEPDGELSELMADHHKHALSADRLQERVHEHVHYAGPHGSQPMGPLRTLVVHDNIEACEPGDESDYSAVLDVPYYKMLVEGSSEPGYVKLRKLEILQNENQSGLEELLTVEEDKSRKHSQESKNGLPSSSTDTDVDQESTLSEDSEHSTTNKDGMALLLEIKAKLDQTLKTQQYKNPMTNINNMKNSKSLNDVSERRLSGAVKVSKHVTKGDFSNLKHLKKANVTLKEENITMNRTMELMENKVGTSNSHDDLSNTGRRLSGLTKFHSNAVQNGNISNLSKFKDNTPSLSEAEENSDDAKRLSGNSGKTDCSSADSDYGYSKIIEQTQPKPLERSAISLSSDDTCVLPVKCFTKLEVEVDVWNNDEDEDDDDQDSQNEEKFKELYETQYFLNSTVFMSNFVNNFMSKLGKSLGFSSYSIEEALTQGTIIYCDTQKHDSIVTCEIIPAVTASWPNIANEWLIRERKIISNPRTNFSYQWPTKTMVNKTRGLGCMMVPLGHRFSKTPDRALQWKVTFPAAERYLESCLAHSQVRCYLFTLGLLKRFMENPKLNVVLNSSHIKTHLFWQCEDNYAKWPEDRLGETLRNFLMSLHRNFKKGVFPDFFIADQDHFKGVPKKIVHRAQWELGKIMEYPVTRVLAMIQRIQYRNAEFYPEFDCMSLYRILTTKNVLQLLNPNIPNGRLDNEDDKEGQEDEKYSAPVGFWEKAKENDKEYQWKRELQRQAKARRIAAIREIRKKSILPDAIEETTVLPQKMEQGRRRLVLEFFIPHFIAMAECSDKFEATKQGILYLEQAKRLTIILTGEAGGEYQSSIFLPEIHHKLTEFKMKMAKVGGPRVPKRNETFQFPSTSKMQHEVHNKHKPSVYVNINNINGTPPPSPLGKISNNNFTMVDVHIESKPMNSRQNIMLKGEWSDEESKL